MDAGLVVSISHTTSIVYGIFILVAVVWLSIDFGVYLLCLFHSTIPFQLMNFYIKINGVK